MKMFEANKKEKCALNSTEYDSKLTNVEGVGF